MKYIELKYECLANTVKPRPDSHIIQFSLSGLQVVLAFPCHSPIIRLNHVIPFPAARLPFFVLYRAHGPEYTANSDLDLIASRIRGRWLLSMSPKSAEWCGFVRIGELTITSLDFFPLLSTQARVSPELRSPSESETASGLRASVVCLDCKCSCQSWERSWLSRFKSCSFGSVDYWRKVRTFSPCSFTSSSGFFAVSPIARCCNQLDYRSSMKNAL